MKFKIFITALILVFISSINVLKAQNKFTSKLPDFSFQKLNGEIYSKANLKSGLATIFMFYDPDCDHCQMQAQWMSSSGPSFKNIQLIWVSTADNDMITDFYKKYFSSFTGNVQFLKDGKFKFDSYFGYSVSPTILVYGSDGNLIKHYTKETPVNELITGIK